MTTSPAPQSPLATAVPWDLVADGYTTDIAPFFERFANDALQLARVQPRERVVDVAAGPGTLSLLAVRNFGAQVSAIDFSPAMIQRLEAAAARRGARIDAQVGDGMNLPYADQSFDAAFSMFGLIFFPDRPRGLSELHRVLVPGGRVVISSWVPMDRVPVLAELFAALKAELPHLPFGGGKAPMGDPEEFRAELAASGFTDVAVREVTHGFEVATVREFVESTERSNAPMALLKKSFEPDRWRALLDALRGRLEEKFGRGPLRVDMTALLGSARRP